MFDIDINLIKSYFEQVARKVEEHCIQSIRCNVSVSPNNYSPLTLNVDIRVYGCDDIKFQETLKDCFTVASNRLMCERCSVFTNLNVNVMMYEKRDTFIYGEFPLPPATEALCIGLKKEEDIMLSVPEVKEIIHSTSKKKGELFTVK